MDKKIAVLGVGGIGGLQRGNLKDHPMVEFAGFCDVDQRELDGVKKQFPKAWTVKDYREAFANRLGDFDAVIVETPDFHHAPMMLTAPAQGLQYVGETATATFKGSQLTIVEGDGRTRICEQEGTR